MTHEQIIRALRAANEVAKEMKKFGHHPFGAVLVGPGNEQIIMSQGNVNVVRHAETELSRRAAETYSSEYLSKCTLVTTMEPCAMCAGTMYWANIGSLVFGGTEAALKRLTGSSKMNETLSLPCKQVFDSGQKSIQVVGPIPEMEEELLEPHHGFWK
jgi:tRNA(Arg) A34 adenosine deaminase TadA